MVRHYDTASITHWSVSGVMKLLDMRECKASKGIMPRCMIPVFHVYNILVGGHFTFTPGFILEHHSAISLSNPTCGTSVRGQALG